MRPRKNSAKVGLKTIRTAALLFWVVVLMAPSVARAQQSVRPKRALALYWYNKDFPINVRFDRGFQAALQSAPAGAVEYYPEYLESNRFPGEDQSLLLHDYLRRKYANLAIDVVVASGNAPLQFCLKHRNDLFPHTPIVFVAGRPPTEELAGGLGVTGIICYTTHRKNLDLALRLHPNTEQVFVISGTLERDKKFEKQAREELQGYESRVKITYLTDLAPDELIVKTKNLPGRSIVLYVWQQSQNEQGKVIESADILAMIAKSAPVPVYGMSDGYVGGGIIGGYVFTLEGNGARAAEIALQIARGARAQDISVESAPTVPMFDWRLLQRWGISEDLLPPGSVIQFKEPSFWNHYKWRIIGVVSLCAVEGLLIFALLAQRARRRRVEEALRDNEERLKLALSAANMGAWDWRLDTSELKWSDEMRQIFGFAGGKSAMTTELFLDLIHPDDRTAVSQAATRTINHGAPYDIEFRTIHQDGSIHWVMGKGKALLDKAGQAARMLGVNMDITDRKRAEERLRSYFELPLIGMAITSPDRRFVEVNQKLCDILGYSKDQLTGMSWVEVTHPDDVVENIRLLDETLRGKIEGYVMDKRFIHRDGHIVYASISARCARRAGRTVDYLTLIVQDITQRKQAEDRLMESEAQLRLLTELIPQHVWTAFPGSTADFRNQRWLDYTGMTIEEVRQKGWMTALHPDDREIVLNSIREASSRKGIYEVEERLKGVDGQYRWFLARAIPQLDQEGNIIKWYGTNTDIEDRKRAEEALRESEARFRNMADNAPVMVWVAEADGACSFVSQSWYEFTGQAPETGLGSGWVAALHPDDRELSEKTFLAANEKREAFRLEYRLRRNDGEYRWASDSAKPRFGSQGEFLGYIGSVVDITETKRAELNTQFINQLDFELSQIADADEIIRLATSRLGEYLGVASCYVIEVNPAADLAVVRESWHGWRLDGKSIVGEYRISDFTTPEFREAIEAGQAAVVDDVRTDPRTRDFAPKYESFGVGAFISIPALNEKQWEATLNINHPHARDWRPDETQLMRDITARLWPAFKRARAVEALRDSEERLRLALEAGRMGAWEWDTRTNAVKWSREYYTILGLQPFSVEPNYYIWEDRVHPGDLIVAMERMSRAIEEKGEYRHEYRIILPDGNMRWVEGRAKPVYDEGGQCLKVSGLVVDITERKEAEEALRESEERYRSVVESQTELICRYLPDTTLTFVNAPYCRYFGKTQEELIGTKFLELIPEPAREFARKHVESLAENPRLEINEHEVLLPDGGIGWQQWVDHAILDSNGKVVEFQAVGRDITERKRIEEERRDGEERLRLALEAGRMGVWEWDTRTDAVKWSKEHYTVMGLMPFSVVPDYQTWADRVRPDDLPVAEEAMRRAIEEKGEYRCEYRINRSDGSVRWVEGRGRPVYDECGQCVKMSGLIVDITERKEAEEALRESEEALRKSYARIEDLAGRLIASQEEERRHIARELHDDLNQQVAALAIGISRLKRQFSNADAVVLEQIARLQNKTDLLSERIRQVSHELHSSILQHVGLPAALNSYCAEFSDREGIAVALDIGDGFEAVPPEAALCLYRVAQESLRNVARHSGARRAVVTLAGVNGAIELRVADQGVGFDPGQARECRGLGLVSMEERVKLLRGNFLLTTRPGAGTELRAQIPLRGEHEQTTGIVG